MVVPSLPRPDRPTKVKLALIVSALAAASAVQAQSPLDPHTLPCEQVQEHMVLATRGALLLSLGKAFETFNWTDPREGEQTRGEVRAFMAPFLPYLEALNERLIACGIDVPQSFIGVATDVEVEEGSAAKAESVSRPARGMDPIGASWPPLTATEKAGFGYAVQRCWNVPAGLRGASDLRIRVAAELDSDGAVISSSVRMIEPATILDGRYDAAWRAARTALLRCSPYSDLPREKFAQWRHIEVVFNPEGMVSW